MSNLTSIARRLRAIRQAREHFFTLWALETAYDLPVRAEAVRQDLRRLENSGDFAARPLNARSDTGRLN